MTSGTLLMELYDNILRDAAGAGKHKNDKEMALLEWGDLGSSMMRN